LGLLDLEVWLVKRVREVHLVKEVRVVLLDLLVKALVLMQLHWLP